MRIAPWSFQGMAPTTQLPPPSHLRALPPALLNTGVRYSRLRVYQRDSAAQPAGK